MEFPSVCSGGGAPREARRGGVIGGVARPAEPFPGGSGGGSPPRKAGEGFGGGRQAPPRGTAEQI